MEGRLCAEQRGVRKAVGHSSAGERAPGGEAREVNGMMSSGGRFCRGWEALKNVEGPLLWEKWENTEKF